MLARSVMSTAQNYTAQETSDHGVAIVRLADAANGVEVSIVPSIGNRVYEMKVHGQNILYSPCADVGEFQKHPEMCGIPFWRHGEIAWISKASGLIVRNIRSTRRSATCVVLSSPFTGCC